MHHVSGSLQLPTDVAVEELPSPVLEEGNAYNIPSLSRLFPHVPNPGDIQQGKLGNCGMLAALVALVSRDDGPDFLQGMMKDEYYSWRVVIRVYDSVDQPHFVRIPRWVPRESYFTTVTKGAQGALWVNMLELVYASFNKLRLKQIEGTSPSLVLQCFLGPAAAEDDQTRVRSSSDIFKNLMEIRYIGPEKRTFPPFLDWAKEEVRDEMCREVFNGDAELFRSWIVWNTIISAQGKNYDAWAMTKHVHVTRERDLERWWHDLGEEQKLLLSPTVQKAVENWVNRNNVLPGRKFSAKYSKVQVDLFAKIKSALASHRLVTAGTMSTFYNKYDRRQDREFRIVDPARGTAGEEGRKGLFEKHWYAVVKADDSRGDSVLEIHVRNPHGQTGRTYIHNRPTLVSGAAGVISKLELSDFTKNFDVVQIR